MAFGTKKGQVKNSGKATLTQFQIDVETCIEHVKINVKAGRIGVGTMDLYSIFSTRTVNAAIKQLLKEGKATISSPVTGYRLKNETEYGVTQALSSKSYDILLV